MAQPERGGATSLNPDPRPSLARRWLLVCAVVLVPVTLGAVATLALYATRANPPAPKATESRASDELVHDGSILIIQPRTTARVAIPVGQVIEIVLQTGAGQAVSANNPAILAAIATPPCHIFTLCGIPGVQTWAFRAAEPGTTALTITFGVSIATACKPTNGACLTMPPGGSTMIKPVTVSASPASG